MNMVILCALCFLYLESLHVWNLHIDNSLVLSFAIFV